MQQGNTYKKFDAVVHTVLLIVGLAMIILSAFDIFAPDHPTIWIILGVLFVIEGVSRFSHKKT
ncbi:hypothetical protein GCM10009001_09070 [Virgibacillus siamensis]|uniref:Uncharacterized protein n=1 Tax=Virgibacillus siamensis TaxID=480071 RepID=A0ABN1FPR5_9BACI